MNSRDRSTLLSSRTPDLTRPEPRVSGGVMRASPLFGPTKKMLFDRAIRPGGFAKDGVINSQRPTVVQNVPGDQVVRTVLFVYKVSGAERDRIQLFHTPLPVDEFCFDPHTRVVEDADRTIPIVDHHSVDAEQMALAAIEVHHSAVGQRGDQFHGAFDSEGT